MQILAFCVLPQLNLGFWDRTLRHSQQEKNDARITFMVAAPAVPGRGGLLPKPSETETNRFFEIDAEFEPSEIQELGDMIPKLLEVRNRSDAPIRFRVHIEFGDGQRKPSAEYLAEVNTLLRKIKDSFGLR